MIEKLKYKIGLSNSFLRRKKRKSFSLMRFIRYAFRKFDAHSKYEL